MTMELVMTFYCSRQCPMLIYSILIKTTNFSFNDQRVASDSLEMVRGATENVQPNLFGEDKFQRERAECSGQICIVYALVHCMSPSIVHIPLPAHTTRNYKENIEHKTISRQRCMTQYKLRRCD